MEEREGYERMLLEGHGNGYIPLAFDLERFDQDGIDKLLRRHVRDLLEKGHLRTRLRPVKRILGVRPRGILYISAENNTSGRDKRFQEYSIYYEI